MTHRDVSGVSVQTREQQHRVNSNQGQLSDKVSDKVTTLDGTYEYVSAQSGSQHSIIFWMRKYPVDVVCTRHHKNSCEIAARSSA